MRSIDTNGFSLSPLERLHSKINAWRLQARTSLAFSRNQYVERPCSENSYQAWLTQWPAPIKSSVLRIELQYQMAPWRQRLNLANYTKNLATLWVLEQILETRFLPPKTSLEALEVGCQDFSRSPAIVQYLRRPDRELSLTGLELDAFPILANFHSRLDLARYYCETLPEARFLAQDFFVWNHPADLLIFFYPFVSPHPSLAWGLPHQYGNSLAWAHAMLRNLGSEGVAVVVHQGQWEEQEFSLALAAAQKTGNRAKVAIRQSVDCPFYPLPHPAVATLYLRDTKSC